MGLTIASLLPLLIRGLPGSGGVVITFLPPFFFSPSPSAICLSLSFVFQSFSPSVWCFRGPGVVREVRGDRKPGATKTSAAASLCRELPRESSFELDGFLSRVSEELSKVGALQGV